MLLEPDTRFIWKGSVLEFSWKNKKYDPRIVPDFGLTPAVASYVANSWHLAGAAPLGEFSI